ncbi:MAG: hypothetical protein WCR52_24005 [Bacteroidota bacterium]
MTALAEKKLEFIREISGIEDINTLAALMEAYWKITNETNARSKPVNTIRQKFNADAIRQRRGHVGHDKAKIMRLIQEMDVQEPIEQLLAQLTK